MLGNSFLSYLHNVPPRSTPKLNLFTERLGERIANSSYRAGHLTTNGPGTRLLTALIKQVDIHVLVASSASLTSITQDLQSKVKDLEKMIDVRSGKHTQTNLFIKSHPVCFELMTPSRRTNVFTDIPSDKPWSDLSWMRLKPMRLVDMGACPLVAQLTGDQIHYRSQGPTHAVYAVDVVVLIAGFIAYYRSMSKPFVLDQLILDYVTNAVVIPCLLEDSASLWLRSRYRQIFVLDSVLEPHTTTVWDVITPDTVTSDWAPGTLEVQHLKQDLLNQSISVNTVLSSLPLTADRVNFVHYYSQLWSTTRTPDDQPWIWVDCLKNLAWWEFILSVAAPQRNLPGVKSMLRDLTRDVRFWMMIKPWQEIRQSIPYRTIIESRLSGMYTYLQNE